MLNTKIYAKNTDHIPIVKNVDLQRYAGKWYEIARMPFYFEKDLVNVTATYTLRDDGKIQVLNEGYVKTPQGKRKQAKGRVKISMP